MNARLPVPLLRLPPLLARSRGRARRRLGALRAVVVGALWLVGGARTARTEPCARPDAPAGYQGFSFGDAPQKVVEGSRVRVVYVETGPHAVAVKGDGNAPAPIAALIAAVGDEALSAYASWGFRTPISDASSPCGAGPLLDLYLVHFSGADGLTATESCVAQGEATTCTSFALIDSRLDQHYPTAEAGVRTVVPHELFHAVQNAYNAEQARFWAEGTSQWAAARLTPALPDLVKNLDDFLDQPGRALDGPVTGVTAAYLYGSAIWPVFLEQRFGADVIEDTLLSQADGLGALAAADEALQTRDSKLADAYATFVLWNLATGERAPVADTPESYAEAGSYPEVPVESLAGRDVPGVLSGLSSAPFLVADHGRSRLDLTTSAATLRAYFLPLNQGRVAPSTAVELPTIAETAGIVVVINTTTSKVDASYHLLRTEAPKDPTTEPSGALEPSAASGESGCSITSTEAFADVRSSSRRSAFLPLPFPPGPLVAFGLIFLFRRAARRPRGVHP
jgi:hypothetical protein